LKPAVQLCSSTLFSGRKNPKRASYLL